jgi:hypothetical protein
LRELRQGQHAELVRAFEEKRYAELFTRVREGRF